jgi:hypothetical protein
MSKIPVNLHGTGHRLINVKLCFNKIILQQVVKCLQDVTFLVHLLLYCHINFLLIVETDLRVDHA